MGMKARADRVTVENVNVPGHTSTVDGAKYREAKRALLKVLPKKAPGMTQSEMMSAVKKTVSTSVFPGREKTGWWTKTVQLDLEAKGVVVRDATKKPLRWRRG